MDMQQIHEIKPLIIRTQSGKIKDVCLMNQKSYTKSIEQGRLWFLHRDTGRVLPYESEHSLLEIKSQSSWYEAIISGSDTSQSQLDRLNPPAAERRQSSDFRLNHQEVPLTEENFCGFILSDLEHIVKDRFHTMPEGSYTTHLFSSGPEKIRKKTGEEAVELILADTPDQIIYEAADLLYHLLVLLVSEDLSYGQVCAELQRRHMNG